MKSLEKNVDEKELNGMPLPRELKCSKQDVKWLKRENKLPQQMTETVLENAVREAGISSRYDEQLLEALGPQYVTLERSISQKIWSMAQN